MPGAGRTTGTDVLGQVQSGPNGDTSIRRYDSPYTPPYWESGSQTNWGLIRYILVVLKEGSGDHQGLLRGFKGGPNPIFQDILHFYPQISLNISKKKKKNHTIGHNFNVCWLKK